MNPADIQEASKEVLVKTLEGYNIIYDEVMANMVMVREELLARLTKEKKDGELILDYSVTKAKRFNFKTTLEEAETLGAIKKAVDTGVLRRLHDKGIKIPGIEITTYLSVRKIEQKNEQAGKI